MTQNEENIRFVFNSKAKLYEEKFMDQKMYARSLNHFCATVSNNTRLLEIACGPGNVSKYLLNQNPSLHITGIDVAPNMIEIARKNNPQARYIVHDAKQLNRFHMGYDAVLSAFYAPYLNEEELAHHVSTISELLPSNGHFYLSTMEGERDFSNFFSSSTGDGPEIYIEFYPKDFVQELFLVNGFEIIYLELTDNPNNMGDSLHDLLIIGKKRLSSQTNSKTIVQV